MSSSSELDPSAAPEEPRRVSLCEALDRMLNTGVVMAGEVVISVADIDLIYLNLQLLLTSIETAWGPRRVSAGASPPIASEP